MIKTSFLGQQWTRTSPWYILHTHRTTLPLRHYCLSRGAVRKGAWYQDTWINTHAALSKEILYIARRTGPTVRFTAYGYNNKEGRILQLLYTYYVAEFLREKATESEEKVARNAKTKINCFIITICDSSHVIIVVVFSLNSQFTCAGELDVSAFLHMSVMRAHLTCSLNNA